MKQFFIFTFHGKCTCVKLCFFIFRNYDKRTQVSLVFLYSNIMVNAHIKLCHSWKKISLMPETECLELFLLYQHLRKQKWNLKNIIRILLLLEMNILRDYITINCFKCQKQNNPTKHCRYEQLRPKTEREREGERLICKCSIGLYGNSATLTADDVKLKEAYLPANKCPQHSFRKCSGDKSSSSWPGIDC